MRKGRDGHEKFSEPPFDSDLFIQLSDCPQNEDVVPAEKVAALEQETTLVVAESKQYVSDLIGESYKHWENGRVILDCGTGRGKNEFIVRRLAGWLVDRTLNGEGKDSILYLCPLNSLHAEMIRRRLKAEIDDMGEEAAAELRLYEDVLKVQTYQYMEKCCRNNSGKLEEYLQGSKYIVADECHYFTDFATYNINTCLSMEELQRTEKDHVVIYMSATGGQIYEMLNAVSQTPSERIYTLPQDYRHITQMYFYARENLVMMLEDLPTDEKAVVFVSGGEDLVRMKEQFGDAAGDYCSENNPKYGKQFDALENCIRDRKLQKRFVFTTKAIGMGIEIKDRTVKHMYSYNPNENERYDMNVFQRNHPVLYNILGTKDSNGEHDKYYHQAVQFHHHIVHALHDVLGNQIGLYCDQYFDNNSSKAFPAHSDPSL